MCSIRPQHSTLWPSYSIWHQRSWSTLLQVMAWFLMAPSHHLNQCWLIISEVLWHHWPEDSLTGNAQDISPWCDLKITKLRLLTHLPGANELKPLDIIGNYILCGQGLAVGLPSNTLLPWTIRPADFLHHATLCWCTFPFFFYLMCAFTFLCFSFIHIFLNQS